MLSVVASDDVFAAIKDCTEIRFSIRFFLIFKGDVQDTGEVVTWGMAPVSGTYFT